jgi:hypothetical protein
MRFAAGLTVSGIVGFIILEALKLVVPTLAAWIIAVLAFLFKAILIGLGLLAAVVVIGIAIYVYKRMNRRRAEA